jgi:carboxypeptidase Q
MKRFHFLLSFYLLIFISSVTAHDADSVMIRKIFNEALQKGAAHSWLKDITENIGARLTGSDAAEKSVEWTKKKMTEAGADHTWLQECMVPHWVRGEKETGKIIDAANNSQQVPVTALGGSVCTPKEGITASIIEVHNFDELKNLGEKNIKGKIVFYNHPFDETYVNTFDAYGEAVDYRWAGPSEAARYGAIATVCRSMTNINDDFPHTGAMHYEDSLPQIPCCAISTNGANLLSHILKADPKAKFFLQMNCQMLDSVKSYNVIGEMKGSEYPEEIIVVGGHLDSWDTGKGSTDDGTGVVQAIDVIRIFKELGIKPKRTIRAVAFMNEENGGRGGAKYADVAKQNHEKHIAAVESDAGGFTPYGFGLEMPDEKKEAIKKWKNLFLPYNIWNFELDHGGSDIDHLKENLQVPCIGLGVDSQRYFDYHHAGSDTFDKVNRRELELGAATMAALIYLLSEHGL